MRLLATLLLCTPLLAAAHGDGHERLKALNAQIAHQPGNADLYMRRGRLHIETHHFDEAQADLKKVLALAPSQHGARYFLAEALLSGGKAAQAEKQVQRFIDAHGSNATGALSRGQWLLGQARMAQSQAVAAIQAYRAALKVTPEPTPDQYQLLVDACLAARGPYPDEALQVLDMRLAAGGSIDLWQGMALEVELQLGRTDAALHRLDAVIAQKKRLPFLYTRKATILADAGRTTDAATALNAARESLASTPDKRQRTPAYTELAQQIAALDARIGKGRHTAPAASGPEHPEHTP